MRQKLIELKWEIEKSTIIVEDFKTPLYETMQGYRTQQQNKPIGSNQHL